MNQRSAQYGNACFPDWPPAGRGCIGKSPSRNMAVSRPAPVVWIFRRRCFEVGTCGALIAPPRRSLDNLAICSLGARALKTVSPPVSAPPPSCHSRWLQFVPSCQRLGRRGSMRVGGLCLWAGDLGLEYLGLGHAGRRLACPLCARVRAPPRRPCASRMRTPLFHDFGSSLVLKTNALSIGPQEPSKIQSVAEESALAGCSLAICP